ncbi:MAG: hypothetical protein QNK16_00010 [Woeseiaceae bacterium]|nr:hypothetical protein [Woeseiaceae bacterium]MDX2606738.1 hypothetical protein [Woeseiaceae bacterium]
MQTKQTTRRRFLVAAITFSGLASVPSSLSWIGSSAAWADTNGENEKNPGAMAQLARLLFPHAELPNEVYAEVIDEVLAWTAADPATDGLLAAAEQALNAEVKQSWFELTQDEQLAMLRALQDKPAIVGIREMVRFRLYQHRTLWQHIGYPGSSKELGGYINRGFDDIDWLPEQP